MMDPLDLLIRLSRQTLEEKQTELETVARVRADAESALANHEEHVQGEFKAVMADLHSLADFSAWSSHAAQRGAALKTRHAELGRVEAAAREALHTAFADSKKLELAQEAAQKLARKEAARRTDLKGDEQQILRRSMAEAK
jgi:hypothetical protein